ncbi:hypothetical protein N6L27_21745 [Leisingera sp. SS27]|uniref:hypothetical protein n=1 Tax=Leisingera sp. SS27 TaxID=2979462 RepID=UPI00232EE4B2|nr:hypothetical protein [Leisingera sp. SS27]MDC0660637.1 hypothetical protein [Leisingera sp. SS27]
MILSNTTWGKAVLASAVGFTLVGTPAAAETPQPRQEFNERAQDTFRAQFPAAFQKIAGDLVYFEFSKLMISVPGSGAAFVALHTLPVFGLDDGTLASTETTRDSPADHF